MRVMVLVKATEATEENPKPTAPEPTDVRPHPWTFRDHVPRANAVISRIDAESAISRTARWDSDLPVA